MAGRPGLFLVWGLFVLGWREEFAFISDLVEVKLVMAADGEEGAVRAEGNAPGGAFGGAEDVSFLLFLQVPEPGCFIVTGTGKRGAIGAKGDGSDPVLMTFEGELLLPLLVMDLDLAIRTCGGEQIAVG